MWFEDIKFRWRLRKLQKVEKKISDSYQSDIDRARADKDFEREQFHVSGMFFELDNVGSEIRWLQHRYVTSQAERLLIPVPKFDTKSKDWSCSDVDGRWSLSPENLARLAREVRQERRERLELVFLWPSALIGLVGGIVGIASVFFG